MAVGQGTDLDRHFWVLSVSTLGGFCACGTGTTGLCLCVGVRGSLRSPKDHEGCLLKTVGLKTSLTNISSRITGLSRMTEPREVGFRHLTFRNSTKTEGSGDCRNRPRWSLRSKGTPTSKHQLPGPLLVKEGNRHRVPGPTRRMVVDQKVREFSTLGRRVAVEMVKSKTRSPSET